MKVTKEFGRQNGEAQFSFLMERNMLEVSVYYKSPTLVSDLNVYQQIPEGDLLFLRLKLEMKNYL